MMRLVWPALLVCTLLSACGTTGRTTPYVVVPLHPLKHQKVISEVHVAPAAMEPGAGVLHAVSVQAWGAFSPDDLRNIEQSVRDTISPHLPAASASADSRVNVYLVVRRYVVRTSNTAGAVLACVAWAATDAKGTVIFQEQFYASAAGYLVTTIGLIKDSVHIAIVRRIASTALALASDPPTLPDPETFKNTSTSLDEAAARLPRTLVSLGDPSLAAFPAPIVSAVGILTPSGVSQIQWKTAQPSGDFDWDGYLRRLSREP
jgi:hypothetical protein